MIIRPVSVTTSLLRIFDDKGPVVESDLQDVMMFNFTVTFSNTKKDRLILHTCVNTVFSQRSAFMLLVRHESIHAETPVENFKKEESSKDESEVENTSHLQKSWTSLKREARNYDVRRDMFLVCAADLISQGLHQLLHLCTRE